MKKLLCFLSTVTLLGDAFATVTINLDADLLKTSGGLAMPESGLVILAADAGNNGFGAPTILSFVSGDDIELARWDLSAGSGGGFGDGVLSTSTGLLSYAGLWDQDDPLRLLWFPTLTLGSLSPGANTSYGTYRSATGVDGSAPWKTPGDGATVSLKFLTTDGHESVGTNPAADGNASNFTPVPEPSSYAAAFSLACLGYGVVVRRRRANA